MTENNHAGAVSAREDSLSRKRFIAGSAALLGGGALAAALPRAASAHRPGNPPTDVDVLNYALTLEHLEYAFYRDGLEKFNEENFQNSSVFNGLGKYLRDNAYENFNQIRDHEDTHVQTLRSVIRDLGGRPVPEATYNFDETAFTSVTRFVTVAQFLENTGVTAYDGAIAHIEAAPLLTASATIATVEARHASYLNLLKQDSPFPDAFDTAAAPRRIAKAVLAENDGFVVSAPEPYGPYASYSAFIRRLPTNPTPS